MGLDAVELVMQIEEAFDITLTDDGAKSVRTVGDLYQGVLRHLSQSSSIDPKEVAWQKLVEIVSHQLQIKPEDILPSTRFVEDLGTV